MFLTLKNIGKIAEASIELNGITVIAGENNTGKSTLGKVLFCIFNSFYRIEQQIDIERKETINQFLVRAYRDVTNKLTMRFDSEEVAKIILQRKDEYILDQNVLQQSIKELFIQADENFEKYVNENNTFFEDLSEKVIRVLNISDEEIFKTVLQKKMEIEFNGQINNIFFSDEDGEIILGIKDTDIKVLVKNNEVQQIINSLSLNTEVIYMDDPLALDDLKYPRFWFSDNYGTHRLHLKKSLVRESSEFSVKNALTEIITSKKIDSIMRKINIVCNGEMIQTKRSEFGYKKHSNDAILDIKNISTGLKTFIILKTLLLNGSLEENGTIILDEPEIHLHPEWQLLFAELIVLIQKEFGMHILLNTHSPYFLNAIEVFAAKYELADKCKYYLAENRNDEKSIVNDVSDNVEKIYKKLARPLQVLENERFSND